MATFRRPSPSTFWWRRFGLVLAGGTFIPTELIAPMRSHRKLTGERPRPNYKCRRTARLRSRELQVVTRLKEGKPNKIIAHELEISVSTVKVHIRNIMKKLHASKRTQVVLLTVAENPTSGRLAASSCCDDRVATY